MNLHIKQFPILFIFIVGSFCNAQEQERVFEDPEDSIRVTNMQNFRPRLLAFSFNINQSIPTGNKYVGKAMKGKGGYDLNAQMYVYKQFFFKVSLGANYFEVEDKSVVGNYNKSTFTHQSLSLGYEFLPFGKIRLGVNLSVLGNADYTNKISNNSGAKQRDSGKMNAYGFYVDYELKHFLAVYFKYDYRNDRTNINVPDELKSTFERTQFHSIGLGFKFYIDDSNLFN